MIYYTIHEGMMKDLSCVSVESLMKMNLGEITVEQYRSLTGYQMSRLGDKLSEVSEYVLIMSMEDGELKDSLLKMLGTEERLCAQFLGTKLVSVDKVKKSDDAKLVFEKKSDDLFLGTKLVTGSCGVYNNWEQTTAQSVIIPEDDDSGWTVV